MARVVVELVMVYQVARLWLRAQVMFLQVGNYGINSIRRETWQDMTLVEHQIKVVEALGSTKI
jgi:hypothetical protein